MIRGQYKPNIDHLLIGGQLRSIVTDARIENRQDILIYEQNYSRTYRHGTFL